MYRSLCYWKNVINCQTGKAQRNGFGMVLGILFESLFVSSLCIFRLGPVRNFSAIRGLRKWGLWGVVGARIKW